MWYANRFNVGREVAVDVSANDYEDENGFFIRSGAGDICYIPVGNLDTEAVTKTVEAQIYFIDPVLVKKILKTGTTATGIYVGYPAN
jgi:hypothetical protein